MPNYNETTITGTAWTRCHQIVIDNTRGLPPTVRFDEEEVISLADRELRKPLGALALAFDPARIIPLVNPATGLPTGAHTTYADAYALLYSAYIAAANDRDAAQAPAQAPAPIPAQE